MESITDLLTNPNYASLAVGEAALLTGLFKRIYDNRQYFPTGAFLKQDPNSELPRENIPKESYDLTNKFDSATAPMLVGLEQTMQIGTTYTGEPVTDAARLLLFAAAAYNAGRLTAPITTRLLWTARIIKADLSDSISLYKEELKTRFEPAISRLQDDKIALQKWFGI